MECEVPIERIEPHVGVDRIDRRLSVTAVGQDTSHHHMCAGRVRFQCEATPRLGKSPVVLTMKQESNRKYPVSLRLYFVQLNRALRNLQTGLQRPLGDF